MLISPAEPYPLKQIGRVSSAPEKLGADFLWHSKHWGIVGVQRKEVGDLVSSVFDGRLSKEIGQMQQLGLAVLMIEGRIAWTEDGLALLGSRWTLAQHLGLLLSVQSSGIWIVQSTGMDNTIMLLSLLEKWTEKSRHSSLKQRNGPKKDEWGKAGNREWEMHLLQGFPGIGPQNASDIVDEFGGVPLAWTVSEKELMGVKGIGKEKARRLIGSVNGWQLDSRFENVGDAD